MAPPSTTTTTTTTTTTVTSTQIKSHEGSPVQPPAVNNATAPQSLTPHLPSPVTCPYHASVLGLSAGTIVPAQSGGPLDRFLHAPAREDPFAYVDGVSTTRKGCACVLMSKGKIDELTRAAILALGDRAMT
ncbi:hypothetical protein BS50DRAFT_400123 [Corynespora cassiicola Philippines]|uniref:Uncharacterized protein n=1 Tax=Corynespora cassiicola Philippines TaxID=1448308 RepID=A0A2T2NKA3_CORCC|nr:hypothetical protein BS50DRAFT_400123 [Corynespora cassiicola Philippines]